MCSSRKFKPLTPAKRSYFLWFFVLSTNVLGALLMYFVILQPGSGAVAYIRVSPDSFRYVFSWLNPPSEHSGVLGGALSLIPGPRFYDTTVPVSVADVQTAIVVAVIATCLVAAPFIGFLRHGWFARYFEFRNSLKDGALFAYLRRFWSDRLLEEVRERREENAHGGTFVDPEQQLHGNAQGWNDLERECLGVGRGVFEQIYHEQYGFRPFVPPFLLLLVVTYIEAVALAFMNPCAAKLQFCPAYFFGVDPVVVISALSGAYFFAVSDAVMGIRRRSLNVTDVYWYALRTFLAVPIAIFFSSTNPAPSQSWGTSAWAFGFAVLPVDVLVKLIRQFGYSFLKLTTNPKEEEGDQLLTLSGLTSPIVVLFLAEGVYSVEQVATADPVLLAIRTGLPFRLMLRFGSLAIVRRHLGDAAQKLTTIGFGDAISIYFFCQTSDANQLAAACEVIKATLQISGTPPAAAATPVPSTITTDIIKVKLQQIAGEEYTEMLAKICSLTAAPTLGPQLGAPPIPTAPAPNSPPLTPVATVNQPTETAIPITRSLARRPFLG